MSSKILKNYMEIFWIFMLGSFGGFIYENLLMIAKGHWALRQGLIYGPLIPVYGVGLIVFYLVARKLNLDKKMKKSYLFIIFLVASFLGALVEYTFSFIQEQIWGTISWNYSNLLLNINGRTSLFIAFIWGIMFIIFSLLIFPKLKQHENLLNKKSMIIITIIVSILTLFDCTISFAATIRQKERSENLEPSNLVEEFLDEHYTDDFLNKIYNNAEKVSK